MPVCPALAAQIVESANAHAVKVRSIKFSRVTLIGTIGSPRSLAVIDDRGRVAASGLSAQTPRRSKIAVMAGEMTRSAFHHGAF